MHKVLVIDDEEVMRNLMRMRLKDTYEVVDTGNPEQAIGLVLQHKPDVILMDLMMPKFSGFELCQSLRALSYTAMVPIFVITGESGAKYRDHLKTLGATAYFEKPVDFKALKERLVLELETKRPERRAHVRVRMRLILKLRGTGPGGKRFEELSATENASAGGFLCACSAPLAIDSIVEVSLWGSEERYVGKAKVLRNENAGEAWQKYALQFTEKNSEWILQAG